MAKPTDFSPWAAEYPRPQLRRGSFFSLDGEWQLGTKAHPEARPIEVPYPPQSVLSGFSDFSEKDEPILYYRREFTLPTGFATPADRIRLHFGAVDQLAAVALNGKAVVTHEGGYLPFWADITDVLVPGSNVLTVTVTDFLSHRYPYGKQRKRRGGMWYTPVSGIWQSVWLEAVPPHAVEALKITPLDTMRGLVRIEVATDAPACLLTIHGEDQPLNVPTVNGMAEIDLSALGEVPRPWTPEDPYLYRLTAKTDTEEAESYFALRTVELRKIGSHTRICLNGVPVFLHGVLDQGYFSDGIFLPKSPEGYARDIAAMKELGFNMLRKHIKIEPEAFYYACDKLGMLVLQDMVNSGGYNWLLDTALPNIGLQHRPDRLPGSAKRRSFFRRHTLETQAHLYNHPCIIGYTIFNEGWGQFCADAMYDTCKAADPTRFYDAASGWFAQKRSDVDSLHIYFQSKQLVAGVRPLLLSECGGFSRAVHGHMFWEKAKYGYGSADSEKQLTQMIEAMYKTMVLPSIPQGLSGCVFTQLCDVEDEINGLYTYDRAICKINKPALQAISEACRLAMQLYGQAPEHSST